MHGRTRIWLCGGILINRLSVLWGSAQDGRVAVQGVLSATRPQGESVENAAAVGEWNTRLLRATSAPCSRVVLSMPRGDVVLKRLTLPAGEASESDVGGMVRLQMTRQLTMAMEGTAVDYVPLNPGVVGPLAAGKPTGDGGGIGGAVASVPGGQGAAAVAVEPAALTNVMAAALPAERMRWCREMAEAGQLGLKRIGLRCYGASALLAERSQRRAGPVLGMTIGWYTVEFVIVENGALTFARAVDLARPGSVNDAEAYAEKIAVEAKRTWMSHRATHGSQEVEVVSVLGGGAFASLAAERSAAQLGCGHELVGVPSSVTVNEKNEGLPVEDVGEFLPLIGLLMEPMTGLEMLDFANPRRAPDLGKARRTKVLLGVLGAIVIAGGGYVAGLQSLSALGSRVRASREKEAVLKKEYDEFLVKHARSSHVEQWSSARVDWLAYLALLNEQLPPPESAVMDGLGAHMSAEVVFTPKSSSYPDGAWVTRQAAAFSLDGKMSQRAVAADLRGRLLDLNFDNVESKGPDIPDHFSFVVTTTKKSPRGGAGSGAGPSGEKSVPGKNSTGASGSGTKANTTSEPKSQPGPDAKGETRPEPKGEGGTKPDPASKGGGVKGGGE